MSGNFSWRRKFRPAVVGITQSMRSQSSFWLHVPIAAVVIALAAWLRLEAWRWVAIVISIALVFSAELFNTSIEQLAKVLHPDHDERIGGALDAAAGAVLVAAIAAAVVGVIVFALPLWQALLG